ncbi:DUF6542 domain-containing protein [Streptomyces sp. NBC_01462]|uniref:DUF6542 domain-containing protein n=1 Tax=Streptomyces sp. NBC_01462 TaxID=2903876 RepID=UPI002E34FA0E|nr:DUF6542 domain-containing protein [Streptomyces sp. NBC_01462]
MEQHRTRPPQYRQRRDAPLPAQAGRSASVGPQKGAPPARRPAPLPAQSGRRLPNPRLTGLGSGLFCGAAMFVLACLDELLFGASPVLYGVLFLPVCALTALWVRRGDLVSAPVVVPIAFAFGLLPLAGGGGGLSGRLMGLVTALATQAGWLYGGTLVAGVISTVRKARQMTRRAAWRRSQAAASRRGTAPATTPASRSAGQLG